MEFYYVAFAYQYAGENTGNIYIYIHISNANSVFFNKLLVLTIVHLYFLETLHGTYSLKWGKMLRDAVNSKDGQKIW